MSTHGKTAKRCHVLFLSVRFNKTNVIKKGNAEDATENEDISHLGSGFTASILSFSLHAKSCSCDGTRVLLCTDAIAEVMT